MRAVDDAPVLPAEDEPLDKPWAPDICASCDGPIDPRNGECRCS